MAKRKGDETRWRGEIRTVSVNLDTARSEIKRGDYQEAEDCIANAEAHLIHLRAVTQAQIQRRDERQKKD